MEAHHLTAGAVQVAPSSQITNAGNVQTQIASPAHLSNSVRSVRKAMELVMVLVSDAHRSARVVESMQPYAWSVRKVIS